MLAAMNAWGEPYARLIPFEADLGGDPSDEDLDQYPPATAIAGAESKSEGGSPPGGARRLPANCNRSVAVTVVAASPLIACRRPHPAIAVIVAVAVAVEGIPNPANEPATTNEPAMVIKPATEPVTTKAMAVEPGGPHVAAAKAAAHVAAAKAAAHVAAAKAAAHVAAAKAAASH